MFILLLGFDVERESQRERPRESDSLRFKGLVREEGLGLVGDGLVGWF